MEKHFISIWFFIGALLSAYGVLILAAGIYQLVVGSARQVVLANLHIEIWWGAGVLILGLFYLIRNFPKGKQE
jgi:hypothetical protein